jgi:hypothetical protein
MKVGSFCLKSVAWCIHPHRESVWDQVLAISHAVQENGLARLHIGNGARQKCHVGAVGGTMGV